MVRYSLLNVENLITSNTCKLQGDSGGPLTVEDQGGRHTLIGDVSFGPGSCEKVNQQGVLVFFQNFSLQVGTPGVYGNIAFFRGWIEFVMRKMGEPERCIG